MGCKNLREHPNLRMVKLLIQNDVEQCIEPALGILGFPTTEGKLFSNLQIQKAECIEKKLQSNEKLVYYKSAFSNDKTKIGSDKKTLS